MGVSLVNALLAGGGDQNVTLLEHEVGKRLEALSSREALQKRQIGNAPFEMQRAAIEDLLSIAFVSHLGSSVLVLPVLQFLRVNAFRVVDATVPLLHSHADRTRPESTVGHSGNASKSITSAGNAWCADRHGRSLGR